MALYFQECNERPPPSVDPFQAAMLTIDNPTPTSDDSPRDEPVDKYLQEHQSLKAVLKLDDDIRSAWLHAICMKIKNLVDHDTLFSANNLARMNSLSLSNLFETPHKQHLALLTNSKLALLPVATWKNAA